MYWRSGIVSCCCGSCYRDLCNVLGFFNCVYHKLLSVLYLVSHSADDDIRTNIEETKIVYVGKSQRLINGSIASGMFASPSTTKSAAVCDWFASDFIVLYPLLFTSHVSSCRHLPLGLQKPFCTDNLIVLCMRGVRFFLVHFHSPPLSYTKPEHSKALEWDYRICVNKMGTRGSLRNTHAGMRTKNCC